MSSAESSRGALHVEGVGELCECGDFALNGLERAASVAQRLPPRRDVRACKAGDTAYLAKVAQSGALQEFDEAMDVAAVDLPRAEPANETPIHGTFLAPDGADAAKQRFGL